MLKALRSNFFCYKGKSVPDSAAWKMFGVWLVVSSGSFNINAEAENSWNDADLLPKSLLKADAFLQQNPHADGRGIRIAIWDQGVALGSPGLEVTSEGKAKIVQVWDATGSDRITLTAPRIPDAENEIRGLSGKTLLLPEECELQNHGVRLGARAAFEYFPSTVNSRIRQESDKQINWDRDQQIQEWESEIQGLETDSEKYAKEIQRLKTLIQSLKQLSNQLSEPGPVFDVIVYRGRDGWSARVDTDFDGDLREEVELSNYHDTQKYATFGKDSLLNFAVEIGDSGEWIDVIVESGTHGTHVAGITAACYPEHPEKNGLAPGAEIVSIKIGDPRLSGMETGQALIRAMELTRQAGCDMINLSYGEPTTLPDEGELTRTLAQFVQETGIYFVSSTGNSGPGLSTAGAPGGCTTEIIGIGAWAPQSLKSAGYSMPDSGISQLYSFSSRGPTDDGSWGVDWIAPGGAYASYPAWTHEPRHLANGTSMAAPNFCGSLALLLSALKADGMEISRPLVLRALANTATHPEFYNRADMGHGVPDLLAAYDYLKSLTSDQLQEPDYDIRVVQPNAGRGILLREPWNQHNASEWTVQVQLNPEAPWTPQQKATFERKILLQPTAKWIQCSTHFLLHADGRSFQTRIHPEGLAPGFYDEEIEGWIADQMELGPVFRIPVALYIPHPLDQGQWSEVVQIQPGELKRLFFNPPAHATYAQWHFESLNPDNSPQVASHWTQPLTQLRLDHRESKQRIQQDSGQPVSGVFQLANDQTVVEWTLGPDWRATQPVNGRLTVSFGGATPTHHPMHSMASDAFIRSWALQTETPGELRPSGKITHFSRMLEPHESKIGPVEGFGKSRNLSDDPRYPNQPPYHQLTIEYLVPTLEGYTSWEPHWDGFEDRLYESDMISFLWTLSDPNGRILRTDDMWPSLVSGLEASEYRLHLYLISADKSWLESLKEMPCRIEWRLKKAQDLKVASNPNQALKRRSDLNTKKVKPNSATPLFWILPKTDAWKDEPLSAGDLLSGTFRLNPDGPSWPVSLTWNDSNEIPDSSKSKKGRTIGADVPPYLNELPGDISHIEDLKTLFTQDTLKSRKLHLQSIIESLELLIPKLPEWKSSLNDDDLFNQLENDLLYRRARAYAYLDLARDSKDPELKQIADAIDQAWTREAVDEKFEQAYQELDKKVNPSDSEYALVYIRREWRQGRHENVLSTLLKLSKENPQSFLYQNKLLKVLQDLGWSAWEERQMNFLVRNFPNKEGTDFGY